MRNILHSSIVYLTVLTAFAAAVLILYQTIKAHRSPYGDFGQPSLPVIDKWTVRSIDTQVVSRHWLRVPKDSIREQIRLLKDLGVNYIAVATPYDRNLELKAWVDEIHSQGLSVWFRSHWAQWEGDDGMQAILSPQEYLDKTIDFITTNRELFKEGDAFTVSVEPEQVGVGIGRRFLTWDNYRQFILDQISYANKAFTKIGLHHKIHTNWISVNGWIVENAFTQELVDKLGLIVIDHYSQQNQTIGNWENPAIYTDMMSRDLDRYYNQWKKPILLGEWGYQIFQESEEQKQAEVIYEVFKMLQTKPYLIGVNYWVHMGHHSRIIGDEYGSNLEYRLGALAIKDFYDDGEIGLLSSTNKNNDK